MRLSIAAVASLLLAVASALFFPLEEEFTEGKEAAAEVEKLISETMPAETLINGAILKPFVEKYELNEGPEPTLGVPEPAKTTGGPKPTEAETTVAERSWYDCDWKGNKRCRDDALCYTTGVNCLPNEGMCKTCGEDQHRCTPEELKKIYCGDEPATTSTIETTEEPLVTDEKDLEDPSCSKVGTSEGPVTCSESWIEEREVCNGGGMHPFNQKELTDIRKCCCKETTEEPEVIEEPVTEEEEEEEMEGESATSEFEAESEDDHVHYGDEDHEEEDGDDEDGEEEDDGDEEEDDDDDDDDARDGELEEGEGEEKTELEPKDEEDDDDDELQKKRKWHPRHHGKHHKKHHKKHHGKHHRRPHHHRHHHRRPHHHRGPHHHRHHHRRPHPRPHPHPHPRPHPHPHPHPRPHKWNCTAHIGKIIKPKFCGKLKCPAYKLTACGNGYEKRCYFGKTGWAMTAADRLDSKTFSWMFRRLFSYIRGRNMRRQKIKMAAPVMVSMSYNSTNHQTKSKMAFFLPLKSPPKPSPKSKVSLKTCPAGCAYVRSFGGYVKNRSLYLYKQLYLLSKALKKDKIAYKKGESAFAGYDSPWKKFNRHNEVWRWEAKEAVTEEETEAEDGDLWRSTYSRFRDE